MLIGFHDAKQVSIDSIWFIFAIGLLIIEDNKLYLEILTSAMQTLSKATSIIHSFLLLYGHQFQCSGIFGSIRTELNSF